MNDACALFSPVLKKKAVLYAKELKFPLFCPSSPLVLLRINSPFWTFDCISSSSRTTEEDKEEEEEEAH